MPSGSALPSSMPSAMPSFIATIPPDNSKKGGKKKGKNDDDVNDDSNFIGKKKNSSSQTPEGSVSTIPAPKNGKKNKKIFSKKKSNVLNGKEGKLRKPSAM
eukprot:CAMPEP_0178923308 /NCGR_PEP_ID=MMETSP0786-20121207/16647_1 /TAXON_ID=186022 /ORGANISM="Thalassionema frauenfeldii, Strain CCMP 1798" /LENGTH=100 /DNA_ID=CAMNT_0020597789 /DNA_START=246 /DNA_END=545 /DNA_ORIENTATION=-